MEEIDRQETAQFLRRMHVEEMKQHHSDANGRIGGTHYYYYQESVNCPNCGETYIIKSKSGYTSSCITHQMDDEEIASRFKELLGTKD